MCYPAVARVPAGEWGVPGMDWAADELCPEPGPGPGLRAPGAPAGQVPRVQAPRPGGRGQVQGLRQPCQEAGALRQVPPPRHRCQGMGFLHPFMKLKAF